MQNNKIEINICSEENKVKESNNIFSNKVLGSAMFGLGSSAVLAAIHPLLVGSNATVTQMVVFGVVSSIYNYVSSAREEIQTSRPKRKM